MMTSVQLKQNTNYVFVFGNTGSGKSTLMAALAKFFSLKTVIQTNPINVDGSGMLYKWISDLSANKFPDRSRVGDIYEIDLGLEFVKGERDLLQITFLEMSGEDLVKIDLRQGSEQLEEKFKRYIENSKMFIVVTDPQRAKEDDILMWQFFNYLSNNGINMSRIGLVVTKWDLADKASLKEFVTQNMPQTTNWLHSDNIEEGKVFSFTVGDIQNDSIKTLNLNDCEKIGKWIYQTLTGK